MCSEAALAKLREKNRTQFEREIIAAVAAEDAAEAKAKAQATEAKSALRLFKKKAAEQKLHAKQQTAIALAAASRVEDMIGRMADVQAQQTAAIEQLTHTQLKQLALIKKKTNGTSTHAATAASTTAEETVDAHAATSAATAAAGATGTIALKRKAQRRAELAQSRQLDPNSLLPSRDAGLPSSPSRSPRARPPFLNFSELPREGSESDDRANGDFAPAVGSAASAADHTVLASPAKSFRYSPRPGAVASSPRSLVRPSGVGAPVPLSPRSPGSDSPRFPLSHLLTSDSSDCISPNASTAAIAVTQLRIHVNAADPQEQEGGSQIQVHPFALHMRPEVRRGSASEREDQHSDPPSRAHSQHSDGSGNVSADAGSANEGGESNGASPVRLHVDPRLLRPLPPPAFTGHSSSLLLSPLSVSPSHGVVSARAHSRSQSAVPSSLMMTPLRPSPLRLLHQRRKAAAEAKDTTTEADAEAASSVSSSPRPGRSHSLIAPPFDFRVPSVSSAAVEGATAPSPRLAFAEPDAGDRMHGQAEAGRTRGATPPSKPNQAADLEHTEGL